MSTSSLANLDAFSAVINSVSSLARCSACSACFFRTCSWRSRNSAFFSSARFICAWRSNSTSRSPALTRVPLGTSRVTTRAFRFWPMMRGTTTAAAFSASTVPCRRSTWVTWRRSTTAVEDGADAAESAAGADALPDAQPTAASSRPWEMRREMECTCCRVRRNKALEERVDISASSFPARSRGGRPRDLPPA